MSLEDDLEAFLVMFERVALPAQWPLEQSAPILALYLMGLAQSTYHNLGSERVKDYKQVKYTILDILEETHCQRFMAKRFPRGHDPKW